MEVNIFKLEIRRLQNRFGEAQYDTEILKLIWAEVRDLEEKDFKIIVDLCIGEFKVEYPPKVSHFREFAVQRRKLRETALNQQAAKKWNLRDQGREPSGDGFRKAVEDPNVMKTLNPQIKSLLEEITKKRGSNGEV